MTDLNPVALHSVLLPILVSAVVVFVASFVTHALLPVHRRDLRKIPQEDAALEALRALKLEPGDYHAPGAETSAEMRAPEYLERRKRGPIVTMTISAGTSAGMGKELVQWFIYLLVIEVFVGYLAARTLVWDMPYLKVFRVVGTAAFLAFGLGHVHQSIWWHRNWGTTIRYMLDGLLYALLSAGVFGWLWPRY